VGPVCGQQCPPGYADDGATCRRGGHIIQADIGECPWYDKCGLMVSRGCSKCPDGYTNDGCICRSNAHVFAKATIMRGAGSPMSCPRGSEKDAGLCYPPCGSATQGVGPVCWLGCPAVMPVVCGAGCARSQKACAKATSEQVLKTTEAVVKAILQNWGGAIAAGVDAANTYRLPLCAP
jgi:hypothetical protein